MLSDSAKQRTMFRPYTYDAMFSLCAVEKTEQSREFVYNYIKPFALSIILKRQLRIIKKYFRYLDLRRAFVLAIVEPLKIFRDIKFNSGKKRS